MGNVVLLDNVQSTDRFQKVPLGKRGPRKKVEVLVPGLLLKGQSHIFFGASDTGKSWIAQYASRECMRECLPVIYFDLENLADVMEERLLDSLQVPQEYIDDYLGYYAGLDLILDHESKAWFIRQMDSFPEPGLIVWDSLLGFLSLAGLKEDASDDFEQWARFFLDQARYRGWTSLVLDHTGHSGEHPRGSSRKSQAVQVVWKVENGRRDKFNRTKVGRQKLTLDKDRLAYLPGKVEVTLGGTPFTFETRYDGVEFLNKNQNTALHELHKVSSAFPASKGEWKDACVPDHMSKATFYRVIEELQAEERRYVEVQDKLYRLTPEGKRQVS